MDTNPYKPPGWWQHLLDQASQNPQPHPDLLRRFAPPNPLVLPKLYVYPFQRTDEATKLKVWELGRKIPNYDSAVWRHDMCGKVMNYSEHGNRDSPNGWEIDHIIPKALNGPSTWANLQPLNWHTNELKGDSYPWSCPV